MHSDGSESMLIRRWDLLCGRKCAFVVTCSCTQSEVTWIKPLIHRLSREIATAWNFPGSDRCQRDLRKNIGEQGANKQ